MMHERSIYPDTAFAVAIYFSLFNHDREVSEITQKAYFSFLNGENIASVRFAYDNATDDYWKRHSGMTNNKAAQP